MLFSGAGATGVKGKRESSFVSSMGVSQGRKSDVKFCNVFRCPFVMKDYNILMCSSHFEISSSSVSASLAVVTHFHQQARAEEELTKPLLSLSPLPSSQTSSRYIFTPQATCIKQTSSGDLVVKTPHLLPLANTSVPKHPMMRVCSTYQLG